MAILHTDGGGGSTGSITTLDLVDTTLHLVRVSPNQMRALQQVGTHHVPFLQHPEWPNKSVLESHMRNAATQTGHPQPTDGEVREAYGLFWSTHKQPLPRAPPRGKQAHHQPPEQEEYVTGTRVPAVLLLAPNVLKTTLRPGRAHGNLWMLPPPTARNFCPPPLPGDALTGTPTTCLRCGPQVLATPWPLLQLLARYYHTPTAHATREQHRWLHTHFEQALAEDTATVASRPNTTAEWRFHRGTWDTKHTALTFPVLAKHRSTTPEAPTYPVKHRCSQVQDWQTIEWTTIQPQKGYLLQYVYGYLTQGHEGNIDYVRMNPAATEIIHQGIGVYATRSLQRATTTPWATTEQGAGVHGYQLTTLCRLPNPDDRKSSHLCGCLGYHEPHPSGRAGGSLGATDRRGGPITPTPPHRGHHLRGLLLRRTKDAGDHRGRRQRYPPTTARPHAPCVGRSRRSSGLPDRQQTGCNCGRPPKPDTRSNNKC